MTGQPSQGTQASSPAATSPVTSPAPTKSTSPPRTPSAAPTGSATKAPAPSPTPTHPAPSPTPPTTAPAVTPGTLAVSTTSILLSALVPTTFTISASGGPVSWSISEPSSLLGKVDISPASGTLQAGQSAKVSITVDGIASVDSTITINPGGHAVTILLGLL